MTPCDRQSESRPDISGRLSFYASWPQKRRMASRTKEAVPAPPARSMFLENSWLFTPGGPAPPSGAWGRDGGPLPWGSPTAAASPRSSPGGWPISARPAARLAEPVMSLTHPVQGKLVFFAAVFFQPAADLVVQVERVAQDSEGNAMLFHKGQQLPEIRVQDGVAAGDVEIGQPVIHPAEKSRQLKKVSLICPQVMKSRCLQVSSEKM